MTDFGIYDKEGRQIDPLLWGILMEDREYAQIGDDYIAGMRVSTVWLGINQDFSGGERPVVFETMIFGGPLDDSTFGRFEDEEQAKRMHAYAVALLHDPVFLRRLESFIRVKYTGRERHGWVKWCRDWRRHVTVVPSAHDHYPHPARRGIGR